ncbi:MAG: hypothetical protein WBE71_18970 [Xanthobacteraceae bacterium]
MSQSQPSGVIHSLQTVRDKVKLRLMKVPEYRAFLAIEMPVAEVADIPDLVVHLQTAKQKILERLTTTQEYRALLTVEKAIKDISEVLDVVGNDATADAAPAAAEKVAEKEAGKEEVASQEDVPAANPHAAAAEEQQSAPAIAAVAAQLAQAPAVVASAAAAVKEAPETYARDAADIAVAVEASGEHHKRPVSNPSERLSTLGHVEEWRLTALVPESYSANVDNEDAPSAGEGKAAATEAKVA